MMQIVCNISMAVILLSVAIMVFTGAIIVVVGVFGEFLENIDKIKRRWRK